MSAPDKWIGLRLIELKTRHNTNRPGGFAVFRLQGQEDTVGIKIIEDYTIQSILERVPTLSFTEIVYAEDYYGQIILRVRSRRG